MRVYISKEFAKKIKNMFDNTPANDCSRLTCWGITDWTHQKFGVKFNGGVKDDYFLEGPSELVTLFILRYNT